jgi:hypothetical protein
MIVATVKHVGPSGHTSTRRVGHQSAPEGPCWGQLRDIRALVADIDQIRMQCSQTVKITGRTTDHLGTALSGLEQVPVGRRG